MTADDTRAPGSFGAVAQAAVDETMEHFNEHHADTVLLVARHLRAGALDARIDRADRRGVTFAIHTRSQHAGEVHLPFPTPVDEAHEVQGHLLAALAAARAAAHSDEPLTSLERELQITRSLTTVHGRVGAVRRLTPALLEVTLTGFTGYPLEGGDEFVYVMVSSAPGGISPHYTMDDYRRQVAGDTVRGAYYTVRRSRPDVGEIDLWVVEHDHPGSVAAWMMSAAPGDPVALWGPRRGYRVHDDARHVLLVADETGFAAVAALLEGLPADRRTTAVLQCLGGDHRPPLPAHPGLEVIWVDRGADSPSTNRLLGEVEALACSPDSVFGAGESREVSAIRRHVRHVLGVPADRVLVTGYWRRQGA